MNSSNEYIPYSEENLCKSVKLNPKSVQAWKELGECFWKKNDIEQADYCFSWILDLGVNPSSLTDLAMVKRRLSKNRTNLDWSIKLCKDALAIDLTYSNAWGKDFFLIVVGLGASYLAYYFHISRNTKDLKMSLKAYEKAVYIEIMIRIPFLKILISIVLEDAFIVILNTMNVPFKILKRLNN